MTPRALLRTVATVPILLYQKLLSPLLPSSCIYDPSCSSYAREAILRHGLLRGSVLAAARISRCLGGVFGGGPDPVPRQFSFRGILDRYRSFRRARHSEDRLRGREDRG